MRSTTIAGFGFPGLEQADADKVHISIKHSEAVELIAVARIKRDWEAVHCTSPSAVISPTSPGTIHCCARY